MSSTVKRKGRRKMWVGVVIVVVVIAVGLSGGILADASGRREIRELSFSNVDFQKLRNGSYVGEYKGTKSHSRDTQVEVMISDGEISDVKVLKGAVNKEGQLVELSGGQNINDLFSNVIQSQTLQVDVISGATLTSKAHLKALENALEQAETD